MIDTATGISVSETAHQLGVTPKTLRQWEREGRLPFTVERTDGGHRRYSASDVEALREALGASMGAAPPVRSAISWPEPPVAPSGTRFLAPDESRRLNVWARACWVAMWDVMWERFDHCTPENRRLLWHMMSAAERRHIAERSSPRPVARPAHARAAGGRHGLA